MYVYKLGQFITSKKISFYIMQYLAAGLAGLQGPFYAGTNCFHRRKVIYGLSPDDLDKGTCYIHTFMFS